MRRLPGRLETICDRLISLVGFPRRPRVFGGFLEDRRIASPKKTAFCESTVSTEGAVSTTSFLLAFSMNASNIGAVADDLRPGVFGTGGMAYARRAVTGGSVGGFGCQRSILFKCTLSGWVAIFKIP